VHLRPRLVGQQVPPQVRRFQVHDKEILAEFFGQFFYFYFVVLEIANIFGRKEETCLSSLFIINLILINDVELHKM
jgi:hypothetical protein